MFTLSICPKPTTPPLSSLLSLPPSVRPSLSPGALLPWRSPSLAHLAVDWVWQCQTCELPQVCLLYTECLKRGRVMLDGQDACNYKNFFWTSTSTQTFACLRTLSHPRTAPWFCQRESCAFNSTNFSRLTGGVISQADVNVTV